MASSNNKSMWKSLVNLVAFVALTLIGVALFLGYVIKANKISQPFLTLAEVLGYLIVAFYALIFVLEKRRSSRQLIIYTVIWVVAVTLIVVFKIL